MNVPNNGSVCRRSQRATATDARLSTVRSRTATVYAISDVARTGGSTLRPAGVDQRRLEQLPVPTLSSLRLTAFDEMYAGKWHDCRITAKDQMSGVVVPDGVGYEARAVTGFFQWLRKF